MEDILIFHTMQSLLGYEKISLLENNIFFLITSFYFLNLDIINPLYVPLPGIGLR